MVGARAAHQANRQAGHQRDETAHPFGLVQPQIGKAQHTAIRQPLGLDGLSGTGGAVHHGGHADDVAARILHARTAVSADAPVVLVSSTTNTR